MDANIITILGIVGGNAAFFIPLFLWNRSEARADAKHFDSENKQLRRDLVDVVRSIDQEMKDFHGRLERQDAEFRTRFLALEERRIKG